MKFIPESSAIACRIFAEAFDDQLLLDGLEADELGSLFTAGHSRPDWGAMARRGPIRVGRPDDVQATDRLVLRRQLDDGQVALSTNAAGLAWIAPDTDQRKLLVPQSLQLLLAQQWARGGLMPLHACAFRLADQGILALGDRGAGKSSLVLAALSVGAEVVSDDWLLLGLDRFQAIQAERLRQFLMLRPGPVVDQFSATLTGDLSISGDGRVVWPIEDDNPRFPISRSIDQCWWLSSPTADRPATTNSAPLAQSAMLAHLVAAAMPLLLTREFAIEQRTLLNALKHIVEQAGCIELTTGRDLLDQPRIILQQLISAKHS